MARALLSLLAWVAIRDTEASTVTNHSIRPHKLNDLLRQVEIIVPGEVVSVSANGHVGAQAWGISCRSFSIGGISVKNSRLSAKSVVMTTALESVGFKCFGQWKYNVSILRDSGSFSVMGSKNHLTLRKVSSAAYDGGLPISATVPKCMPSLQPSLRLWGGATGFILNLVIRGRIWRLIRETVETVLCNVTKSFTSSSLSGVLFFVAGTLSPYVPCPANMLDNASSSSKDMHCSLQNVSVPNPLLEEGALIRQVTNGTLLDLANPFFLKEILQPADDWLREKIHIRQPNRGKNSKDLRINVGVRSLLNGTGRFSCGAVLADLDIDSDQFKEGHLVVGNLTLDGLDTFVEFGMPLVLGTCTMSHHIKMRKVTASVDLDLSVWPKIHQQSLQVKSLGLNDKFRITLGLQNLSATISHLVAVDLHRFLRLRIGQLWPNPLPCVLSTLLSANLTNLSLTFVNIIGPSTDGFIGEGVDKLVTGVVQTMRFLYLKPLQAALPQVLQSEAKDVLNLMLNKVLKEQSSLCLTRLDISPVPTYFNFKTSKEWTWIQSKLKSHAAPNKLNGVIAKATENMNPTGIPGLVTRKNLLATEINIHPGRAFVALSNLRISYLDTLSQLQLFEPISSDILRVGLAMGERPLGAPNETAAGLQLQFDVSERFSEVGDGWNNFTITLKVSCLSIFIDLLMQVDEARFNSLQLRQLSNVNCLLGTLKTGGLRIHDLRIAVQNFSVDLTCSHCSNSYLVKLGETWRRESEEWAMLMHQLVARLFIYAIGPDLGQIIDNRLIFASSACARDSSPHSEYSSQLPSEDNALHELEYKLFLVVAVVGMFLAFACLACNCNQSDSYNAEEMWDNETPSLVCSDRIPLCPRLLVVITLVICAGLFACGIVCHSLSIDAVVEVGDKEFFIDDIFETNTLGFARTILTSQLDSGAVVQIGGHEFNITHIANTGAFGLAHVILTTQPGWATFGGILLLFFGCVFPFFRILGLILVWCIPPLYMHHQKALLACMNFFGKWAFVEIYIGGILLIVRNAHLEVNTPATHSILPANSFSVSVKVKPAIGLYLLVSAQVLVQCVSDVILYFHQSQRKHFQRFGFECQDSPDRRSMSQQCFSLADRSCCSWIERFIVPATGGLVVLLLFIGAFSHSLKVTFFGILGIVIEIGGGDRSSSFALAGLATSMSTEAILGYGPAILYMAFLVFTFIVPVAFALSISLLWSLPLTFKEHERLLLFSETMQSWQYLEAYLVGSFAFVCMTVPVSRLVHVSTGAHQGLIARLLDVLKDSEIIAQEDATLLHLRADLLWGSLCLLVASVILGCLGSFVLRNSNRLLGAWNTEEHVLSPYAGGDVEQNEDSWSGLASCRYSQMSHSSSTSVDSRTSSGRGDKVGLEPSEESESRPMWDMGCLVSRSESSEYDFSDVAADSTNSSGFVGQHD